MFYFPPPPKPRTVTVACPTCGCAVAAPFYATSVTEYFRCVACQQIRAVGREQGG